MAFKVIFALCALSVSAVFGQLSGCGCGNGFNTGLTYGNALNAGLGSSYGIIAPSVNGGGFPTVSGGPISPSGLSAYSENGIEGVLAINGNLPFASAVALEGNLPTAGSAGINYGCGSALSLNSVGNGVGLSGAGLAGYGSLGNLAGYGLGLQSGLGCGCGY